MKKSTTFILLAMIAGSSMGQCFKTIYAPDLNSGQIVIKEKIFVPGKTKSDIYDKASAWFITNISVQPIKAERNRDIDRIMSSNKDLGLIKGTIQINYLYKNGYRYILFDITIAANDGFYEYTINGFNMNRKPIEVYLRTKENDKYYAIAFEDICKKLTATISGMKNSIK
jgi:hypothetical protein